jgi:putative metalloprotease
MLKGYEISNIKAAPVALKVGVIAVFTGLFLAACSNTGGTALSSDNAGGMVTAGASALKAATLSDADVKDLSDKSCAALDGQAKIAAAKSPEAKRLAKIVKGMPAAVNGVPLDYKVYLTKDVNAWAMGNGCVRVYGGLMKLMNDNEVRAVIGHEIGHVALGHSKSSMQTAYAASAVRQVAASAGNSAVAALSNSQLGELAEKLVNAQFSQVQESAADDYAFDLLTAAKLNRNGLVTSFEKLAKLGDENSMFSSHPPSSERAKHMRERLAAKK